MQRNFFSILTATLAVAALLLTAISLGFPLLYSLRNDLRRSPPSLTPDEMTGVTLAISLVPKGKLFRGETS